MTAKTTVKNSLKKQETVDDQERKMKKETDSVMSMMFEQNLFKNGPREHRATLYKIFDHEEYGITKDQRWKEIKLHLKFGLIELAVVITLIYIASTMLVMSN